MKERLSYSAPDSENNYTAEEISQQENKHGRLGRALLRRLFGVSSQDKREVANDNTDYSPITQGEAVAQTTNDSAEQPQSENPPEAEEEANSAPEQEQQETEGEYWRNQIEQAVNESMPDFKELMRQLEAGEHESTKTILPYDDKQIPIYNVGNIRFPYLEHSIMYNTNTGSARLLVDKPELFEKTKQQVEYENRATSSLLSFNYRDPRNYTNVSQSRQVSYGCLEVLPKTLVDFGFSTIIPNATNEETIKNQVDDTKNKLLKYNDNMLPSHDQIINILAQAPEVQVLRYDENGNPAYRPLFIKIPQIPPLEQRSEDDKQFLLIALKQAAHFGVPIFEFPAGHVLTKEEKLKNSPEYRLNDIRQRIDDEIDELAERRGGSMRFRDLLERLAESSSNPDWTERHKNLYPHLLELTLQREKIEEELRRQGGESNSNPAQEELPSEPAVQELPHEEPLNEPAVQEPPREELPNEPTVQEPPQEESPNELSTQEPTQEQKPEDNNLSQDNNRETEEQDTLTGELEKIKQQIQNEIDILADQALTPTRKEKRRLGLEKLAKSSEGRGWGTDNRRRYSDLYDMVVQKEDIEAKLGLGPSIEEKIEMVIEDYIADAVEDGASDEDKEQLEQKLRRLAASTDGWRPGQRIRYKQLHDLVLQKTSDAMQK